MSYGYSFDGDAVYPGDIKNITVSVENSGTGDLSDVTAVLEETTGADVTISAPQMISLIEGQNTTDIVFNVDFSESIQSGTGLNFGLNLTSLSGYSDTYSFDLNVGMTENFETGDFTNNPWIFEGDLEWTTDNATYYAGEYSSRSGLITHSQYSTMKVSFEYIENGMMTFYRKVSSESGYDKLNFYIDGVLQNSWSGESNWTYMSYPVSQGIHTFTWEYRKDSSISNGSDCAWIDNILATNILLGIDGEDSLIPEKVILEQNYPNPFNPVTTINFSVPSSQDVNLNIYNSNGQLVRNILQRKMNRGFYSVTVDAAQFNSGIYFYTLETADKKLTRKMLLVK